MRFLDLHLHGAFGIDLMTASAADLDRLARGLEAEGYGSFLPTLVPLPLDGLEPVVQRLVAWTASRSADDGRGARPLGLHFEGPFLAPKRCGAIDPARFLTGRDGAAVDRFFGLMDSLAGRNMVTLAPEIPGGLELVAEFSKRGFLVSMGHTDADYQTLERAVAVGARHMTHFCNAMRPLHHRSPGPIDFGLAADTVSIDVIADGRHVSDSMLRLILNAKRPDRLALISDAIPAAGQGDGRYQLFGETITVSDGVARNAAGAMAGSVALLQQGVNRLTSLGISRQTALECASTTPHLLLLAGGEEVGLEER